MPGVSAAARQSQNSDPLRFLTTFANRHERHRPGFIAFNPLRKRLDSRRGRADVRPDLVVDLGFARSYSVRISAVRAPSGADHDTVGHLHEFGIRFAGPASASEGSQAGDMTMEMPTPGAAHFKLEKLVGFWRGEERVYPSPWDPRGGVAVGRVRNRIALGGFVLIHDYEQERNGKTALVGHAVLRWDATAERYILLWFDSMGMPPNEFSGDLEGDVLTLVSQDLQGWIRAVWDFGEQGRYSYLMEASPDGENWEPLMEGEYLREG